jgi:hypothetical protein
MKNEEKEQLKKQVEDFLEHSGGLSNNRIYERIQDLEHIISREKFVQLLEEWAKEKDSLIKKDTKDDWYIHKNNVDKTHETEYYHTVVDWLSNNLKIESQELNHLTANKAKKGIHQWRFPDIVGIRKTNYHGGILKVANLTGQKYFPEIWSFEVKKELSKGNLRNYFFECLSNSGWANRRYVVVVSDIGKNPKIDDEVISEFRKLSLRYHVGLIQITTMNTTISEEGGSSILVECPRQDLDLEIMHDLCVSLPEFKDWLESLEEVK